LPWVLCLSRQGYSSPAQLGLRLLRRLPKILTQRFEVLVLADTAFGSNEFITEVRPLKYHALGIRCDRKPRWTRCRTNAQRVKVRLLGLKLPVHISWYYLKRSDGKLENALVLCTKALKGSTMTWWVVTAGFLKAFSRPQNIGLGYTALGKGHY